MRRDATLHQAVQQGQLHGRDEVVQVQPAVALEIARLRAHPGARNAVLAESDTGRNTTFLERSIFLVQIKFVGLSIVGDKNVGPPVFVVVEDRDSQTFGSWIAHPSLMRGVFEFPAAQVVPQAH